MKASNVPNILWHKPSLDDLDFCGVNMHPTLIDHKSQKDDIHYTESALVNVSIELVVSEKR